MARHALSGGASADDRPKASGDAARRRRAAVRLRLLPKESDIAAVRRLAAVAGVFSKAEQGVAVELIETRMQDGKRCGYFFAFADLGGAPIGYCTWGRIPMTAASWDLYWIVVDPAHRREGLGRALLERAEQEIGRRGGLQVFIETSSRAEYAPTRKFYSRAGYRRAARFADFYAPGDDKIVFRKALGPTAAGRP